MSLRQAAQQALEALENAYMVNSWAWVDQKKHVITALRAALAEPEQNPFGDDAERYARKLREERESCKAIFTAPTPQPEQEPVAWQWLDTANYRKKLPADAIPEHWRPLYTAPTPRRPLTDAEMPTLFVGGLALNSEATTEIVRAVEKAHGIGEQHGS